MDIIINPISRLNGEINAPGSKSYSHRAFIAASLANGISKIKNPLTSGDVEVTINFLKDLKVNILKESENTYLVKRTEKSYKSIFKTIDCKNSGTTFRIFTALALLIDGGLTLTGTFLKRNRPITPLLDALKSVGGHYKFSRNELQIQRLQKKCDPMQIPGDISSQFITALLFLSPLIRCNNSNRIVIQLTTPLISQSYVKITLDVLNSFGINIQERIDEQKKGKYIITCGQVYRPQMYEVPGDFSSAAFIIAAAVLAPEDSNVIIKNLDIQNPQGDKALIEILRKMGAKIEVIQDDKKVVISGNILKNPLKGIEIDCGDIPDLFPILSVVGAFAEGKTTLYNAPNLRLKESDRISIMSRELTKMGVNVEEEEEKLTIHHCVDLKGSKIDHENDHRIAMASCIAALYAKTSSEIKNIDIIRDSYPTFIEDLTKLGVKFNKI